MDGNWRKKQETAACLYADGNDPTEVKLGCGRQRDLMGPCS